MSAISSHPLFQSHLVRELAWIIQSTPLMKTIDVDCTVADDIYFKELYNSALPLLLEWDSRTELLEEFMAQRPTQLLGKRFEHFLLFFFLHHPRFEVLLHNQPLQSGSLTKGEIDFVVRDLNLNVLYHLEVTCKFYLSSAHSRQTNKWLGPNSSDRLDLKLDKLTQQLMRLKDEALMKSLIDNGLIPREPIVPLLWMKGGFYHHYSNLIHPVHPNGASPRYPSGWWVHRSEFQKISHPSFRWLVLEKNAWLCPQHEPSDSTCLMQDNHVLSYLDDAFQRNNRGRLLVKMQEHDTGWSEIERGFVVSDSWPG